MKPLILLFGCMGLILFIVPLFAWEIAGDLTKIKDGQ